MKLSAAVAASLAGCASHASDIAAAYVSPIQYQSYSCAQLQEEAARVSSRAAAASGAQDQKANNDAVATGVALVLFWPAAFLVKGDAASAQQVAQLKGDMEAIEEANIQKKCGLQFHRPVDPNMAATTDPNAPLNPDMSRMNHEHASAPVQ